MVDARLNPETAVQFVKGVGPRRAEHLEKAGIFTVADLLQHYPRRYLDRQRVKKIRQLQAGDDTTVVGKVLACGIERGRRSRFVVHLDDGSGSLLQCIWFQGVAYLDKSFKTGQLVAFSGKITQYRGRQMVHPEYDRLGDDDSDTVHTRGIIPMYPSTETLSRAGLDSRGFRRLLHYCVNHLEADISDYMPDELLKKNKLCTLTESLRQIHFPESWDALEAARDRLKFDEIFAMQLALAVQRVSLARPETGYTFDNRGDNVKILLQSLAFDLTGAQNRVIGEIEADLVSGRPMNRLIQGDVGSGKTLVAIIAMLKAVENGFQAAMMAPTEILAEQHYLTLKDWLEPMGIKVVLLRGNQRVAVRRPILAAILSGEAQIAIGTHALVQEGVDFFKLGLIVVDEQHRFGVMQRAALRDKGKRPHVLVMTATPIPRTLALTLYGDLDVSVIDELPKGRQPIRTAWRKEDARSAIYDFIRDEVNAGRQAYIVYPLVEESEKIDLADATAGYELLSKTTFKDFKLGLLHGRMKAEEKEAIMHSFKAGEIKILVSTTVIEVGVDVANASVMLIEHSERFGLPQLHQLRGRVGRGIHRSTCILLSIESVTDHAFKRLNTMVRTCDGFEIAEADLEIRGAGELLGTRQSGTLPFILADLTTDIAIIEKARRSAYLLVENDPNLIKPEHAELAQRLRKKYSNKIGLLAVG
ncbi:ATP-dependent DNA helicase RecG [bacterium]|nr:ATP-dependent DNA helicase RecG [bacterium]